MTNEEIIKLGTTLGLEFNVKTNYKDTLESNRVVFDGVNGQRFLVDGSWTDDNILSYMGSCLILMGRRAKCLEINQVLSINSD